MMLRSNDSYFDGDVDIYIEKQSKLLGSLDETVGDFSYQFELPRTDNNMSILGFPLPDAVKSIYRSVPGEILGEDGSPIYTGQIRLEKVSDNLYCSFFSGNYNWINAITGNMTELELSQYDTELSELNIISSFTQDSGLVYPFVDLGALITRGYRSLKTEDFVGSFYVKTLMSEIFNNAGLKLSGDLINDPVYNKLVVSSNSRYKTAVDDSSMFIATAVSQSATNTFFEFELLTDQYYVGSDITVATPASATTFTFANGLIADLEIEVEADDAMSINIRRNGSLVLLGGVTVGVTGVKNFKGRTSLKINSGDVIGFGGIAASGNISSLKIKLTPVFIYRSVGRAAVPLWTQAQFVDNIMKLFCCIADFDSASKTVTINFFDKISTKNHIDLSQFIEVYDTDFAEAVDGYGQITTLAYSESNDEDLNEYNISKFIKYGAGQISIENDFIEKNVNLFTSDISSPISYINLAFLSSLERINFVEISPATKSTTAMVITSDITSVTDDAGKARLNITDADNTFEVNDVVRLEFDSIYTDGDYIVEEVTTTYIVVIGLSFGNTATGTATKMRYELTTDDSVHIFVHTPDVAFSDISEFSDFTLDDSLYSALTSDYFNLLKNGRPIESETQGLSFGSITNSSSFQLNLIDSYWGQFSRVVNDPVKLYARGYIPKSVFTSLTCLSPIRIRTEETDNLYYLNRISGYKNSYTPCEIELIKLS